MSFLLIFGIFLFSLIILLPKLELILINLYYFMRQYWQCRKIPFPFGRFPIGNISQEKNKALQYADFYRNYGNDHPIIGFNNMFLSPSLLISDLNLIRNVLIKHFEYFQNRGMFYNEKNDPLSVILGTMDHDDWKPLRSKLTPAFTSAKMKKMISTILAEYKLVDSLNEIIRTDEAVVDIRAIYGQFLTDVIAKEAIGIQWDTLNVSNAKFQEIMKKSREPYLQSSWNLWATAHPELSRFLRIRKHHKDVIDFFIDIIHRIVEYRERNDIKCNDFMNALIELKRNGDLTMNQITALVYDLLSAGNADISSTLAYCLYELSLEKNKAIQVNARNEIQSVLKDHNDDLYEALGQMTYSEKVIKGEFIFMKIFFFNLRHSNNR